MDNGCDHFFLVLPTVVVSTFERVAFLSVGVGLTPEMLPMIITASLAKGSIIMAKEKVVIKKLNAIQDLGAIDNPLYRQDRNLDPR